MKDHKQINGSILEIKWGTSRSREYYGYSTCSCWFNNKKYGFTTGSGYDMRGTVLGEFINKFFYEELKKKNCKKYYGFRFFNNKRRKNQNRWSKDCSGIFLDGGCGWNSMLTVLEECCGYKLEFIKETAKSNLYVIRSTK